MNDRDMIISLDIKIDKSFTKSALLGIGSPGSPKSPYSEDGTLCSSKPFQDDYVSDDVKEKKRRKWNNPKDIFESGDDEEGEDEDSEDYISGQKRVDEEWQFNLQRVNNSRDICLQSNEKLENLSNEDHSICGEMGISGSSNFLTILKQRMSEIPSCNQLENHKQEDENENDQMLQRQISSLRELPSYMLEKSNFLLGERTSAFYGGILKKGVDGLDDGIDEIDEIDEDESQSKWIDTRNHRKKSTLNPIYNCNEVRLRFRIDSMNAHEENSGSDNDDIRSNIESIKSSHSRLKQKRLLKQSRALRSCINL